MESKGKVLLFANTFWYLYKFRSNLITRLRSEGYEPVACGPRGDDYQSRLDCRTIAFSLDRHSTNPLKELNSFCQIAELVRREKPSHVLTYTPKLNLYAAIAARMYNVPYIVNISGVGKSFSSSKLLRVIVETAYRISLKRAAHVFFQNDQDMGYFVSRRIVCGSYSRIYGSGVDLDYFKPQTIAGLHGRRTFLFAARLIKEKGILEYLEAARQVYAEGYKATFLCCGAFEDENVKGAVESAVRDGIINYLGLVDDMRSVLERSDCVVLPTYYNEGVPRILIEAIAMGRIAITTALPGCRDVINEGDSGFFVPSRNSNILNEHIIEVIKMEDRRISEMGNICMHRACFMFDEEKIINEYMQRIENKIGAKVK